MADTDDIQERIRRRAHELWEKEGRPQGRDADHWTQAEAEIRGSGAVEPTGKVAGSRRKAADKSTRAAAESLSEVARSPADGTKPHRDQPAKKAAGTVKSPRGPKKDGGKSASAG
ncbi:hypothetical protein AZL_d00240 (plasmid) [Azospirillum sp. B510]|uniref:DUF2934 domain-containing protein n=1 Tax=Azospirillum sp. (strain B510) TaxID=137722 RepID=UPI0001C4CB5A|nr:DUF2934 domain-containing protein [Azospirillum sp. B510]BAI75850.1 hypothetical protein AZL_d00240 [Azospirillum sp. B510]